MRLLIITYFFVYSNTTLGQIVNSLSADKTGMFYYSVDSLIRTFKNQKTIKKIILRADWNTIKDFPDTIAGIKITKDDRTAEFKMKTIGDNDVLLIIDPISIIRNQITLGIAAMTKNEKQLYFFEDGLYKFYFEYFPETLTYELIRIKIGRVH